MTILETMSGDALRSHHLQDLLQDQAAVRRLLDMSNRRVKEYEDAKNFFRHVPNRPLRILLDFDVIWSYTGIDRSKRNSGINLRWFFVDPLGLPYAIPRGAFEELLERLAGLLKSARLPDIEGLSATEVIAKVLGVDLVNLSSEGPDLDREIDDRFTNHTRGIHRLISIFRNPRCEQAIICNYDQELLTDALTAIRHQRRDGKRRSNRDERDATNLAVVLRSNRNEEDFVYSLLLSSTKAVIRASRDLIALMKHGHWVAVTPQQLRLPVQFGVEPRRRKASMSDANTLARQFRKLAETFGDRLDEADGVNRRHRGALSQMEQSIQNIAETNERLKAQERRLERVEMERAAFVSFDTAGLISPQRRRISSGFDFKYANYLKLLDAFVSTLEGFEVPSYSREEIHVPESLGYREYQIGLAEHPHPPLDVITIRIYKDKSGNFFWTGQWPISEDSRQLIGCLCELDVSGLLRIWEVAEGEVSSPEFPLDGASPLWHQGVVISWTDAACGLPFSWLHTKGRWAALSPGRLSALLSEVLVDYRGKETTGSTTSPSFEAISELDTSCLEEIRINTPNFDLVFDLVPPGDMPRCRLTVLSHQPIGNVVACLYDWLGQRFVLRAPLTQVINHTLLPHMQAGEDAEDMT